MPPAARITDNHTCPSHGGGPTSTGESTVIIGFQPAARVSDQLVCSGPPDAIAKGEPSVIIGGKDAARLGDPTAHGGKVAQGCPTVRIGPEHQGTCMLAAAAQGAPMVEQG
jgi:uncharacterized Zn-binding protein involved in type VI secretion